MVMLTLLVGMQAACSDPQRDLPVSPRYYLCGEFNEWHPDSAWAFEPCGEGTYVLRDKEVYLDMNIVVRNADGTRNVFGGNRTQSSIVPGEPYRLTRSTICYLTLGYERVVCDSVVLRVDGENATLTLCTAMPPRLPEALQSTAADTAVSKICGEASGVRVLTLGNSITGRNRCDTLFNRLAQREGVDAACFSHWKSMASLDDLWNEGPWFDSQLRLSARGLVASTGWTHVVLQEKSLLPLYHPDAFLRSVTRWAQYIRQNCPNRDVEILVMANYPLSEPRAQYAWASETLALTTQEVAHRAKVRVCPVGQAYAAWLADHGPETIEQLYADERHPTLAGSQLMASVIFSTVAEGRSSVSNKNRFGTFKNQRWAMPLSGVALDWSLVDIKK